MREVKRDKGKEGRRKEGKDSQGQEFDGSMKDFSEEEPMFVGEDSGGLGDIRKVECQDVIIESSLQVITTLTWP